MPQIEAGSMLSYHCKGAAISIVKHTFKYL